MSSRAFRRLNADADVIRITENVEGDEEAEEGPGFVSVACKNKGPVVNPFSLLNESDDAEDESEDREEERKAATSVSQVSRRPRRRKKKKRRGKAAREEQRASDESGDEVDAAVREVNKLLGEVVKEEKVGQRETETAPVPHTLLKVDRRYLSAENEMRRIFGSKVVRGEQVRQRAHRKVHLKPTVLASPSDTWPKIEKLGLTMQHDGVRDRCQYFHFEHSPAYQKVQLRFWEAVDTLDPNSIAVILHAHPYHIDSLLQMSEVSRLGDDIQMAAELIERALYSFECNFHTLFNYTQADCRLDYTRAENRSLFLTLFRHLSYVSRRGCHRTALEFCKMLLALNPETDPLCVLLIIDYCAVRSGEYQFIIDLFHAWEPHRNLSQLPNFAFSVPLAMFHSGQGTEGAGEERRETEADQRLQNALLTFPCLLNILLGKCGVSLDDAVTTDSFFTQSIEWEPKGLKLLIELYVERSHSLWKEPEVLTWLESNCRVAIARAKNKDPLLADSRAKSVKRYSGVPRNIYRHILISDLDRIVSALPPEMTQTSINSYDPLPPPDSTCGYERPQRTRRELAEAGENPLVLLFRSLLPHYNPMVRAEAAPPDPSGVLGLVQRQIERARQYYEDYHAGQEGEENVAGPPVGEQQRRLVGPGGEENVAGPPVGEQQRRVVGPGGEENVAGPPVGEQQRRVVGPGGEEGLDEVHQGLLEALRNMLGGHTAQGHNESSSDTGNEAT